MTLDILLAFAIYVGLTFSLVFLKGRNRGVGLSKIEQFKFKKALKLKKHISIIIVCFFTTYHTSQFNFKNQDCLGQ